MERGGDCGERNGNERAQVASVAERNPPQARGLVHREDRVFYPSSSFGFSTMVHLSSGGVMRVVTSTMMTTAE